MKTTTGGENTLRNISKIRELLYLNTTDFKRFLNLWKRAWYLRSDSRNSNKRTLFYARKGLENDGHSFIPALLGKNNKLLTQDSKEDSKIPQALGVLADKSYPRQKPELEKKIIRISGLNDGGLLLAGKIAALFYDHPSHRLRMVGVTGTDGKTTTTTLLAHGYDSWGYRSAIIGTNGISVVNMTNAASVDSKLNIPKIPYFNQPNTTPDPIMLQEVLYYLYKHGIKVVVMEVSSHGIHMGRVNEVAFDSIIWTNLSSEHLDYHGTMKHYAFAKRAVFSLLSTKSIKPLKLSKHKQQPKSAQAIVGLDSFVELYAQPKNRSWIKTLLSELQTEVNPTWFLHRDLLKTQPKILATLFKYVASDKLFTYAQKYEKQNIKDYRKGLARSGQFINQITINKPDNPNDLFFVSNIPKPRYTFHLNLIGHFNAQNLTAAALELQHFNYFTKQEKIDNKIHEQYLKKLSATWESIQVKGRLEVFPLTSLAKYSSHPYYKKLKSALVYIDYAHTEGALNKALTALLPLKNIGLTPNKKSSIKKTDKVGDRKLIVLFGAGGDRDKQKRFPMGKVSCALSDITIITDDNPRTEDAKSIRDEIVRGWQSHYKKLSKKNQAQKHLEVIPGRRDALARMLVLLNKHDGAVVLLAGKGHEDYQIIGKTKYPFDERVVLQELIAAY